MTRTTNTRKHARSWYALLASAASVAATACSEPTTSTSQLERSANAALSASLASLPAGYGNLTSSFVDSAARDSSVWCGGGRDARLAGGSLMGGGLGDAFLGGIAGGHFGNHGPFGGGLGCSGATFSSATGRVTCPTVTRDGLTLTRSAAYSNATGQVQQAFDSLTTNTVNLQTSVTGTRTFAAGSEGGSDSGSDSSGSNRGPGGGGGSHGGRHGWGDGRGPGGRLLGDTATILSATTTVESFSNRTVSGLAQGSTQRTVSGTSSGNESTTGTSSRGSFTATRTVADTTRGLVVPVVTSGATYPTAGTVVRAMTATLTYTGQSTATVSRREVVTYDGSATAQVVITEDGVTKNCTRPLPRGPLTCQ